ncbi:MAG: long-chain fatty acid--CoA ligase [Candidatus Omnitrophota bacterium]
MEYRNLPDIIKHKAEQHPLRTAIVFGKRKYSYNELYENAKTIGSVLKQKGVQKNDKVALLLDNCPDFVFCYFGILLAQAIIVPINHMFKRDEIKFILEDSQSTTLITSAAYTRIAQELNVMIHDLSNILYTNQNTQDEPSLKKYASGNLPLENKPIIHQNNISGQDIAVFLYTSGTTGHPKAAQLSHNNLLANVISSTKTIRTTRKDTFICFLPLFHSFAVTVCMLMPLYSGAKVVIMKSPRPVKKLLRMIRRNKVTIFVGIPSIYGILKDFKLPKFLPLRLLRLFNPIRLCISGAAALPIEVFTKFEKKFGIPLLEGYGLTEASPVVSLNPLKGKRKPGSIGLPIPNVKVKIVDEQEREVGTGQIGELCVHGPNIMKGYFKKEKETKEILSNNWLKTGDMAKKDDEGYLYIVDRKKDMVNVRGLNVYPREIEEILYQNPDIKEAAVIGVADIHKGEVPKGFVVLRENATCTEHDIINYLKQRLALYKIPRRIEIRESLPKNTTGKILKRHLAQEGKS